MRLAELSTEEGAYYQAWPSRVQLAHFGRPESHLSLRLRQTRHAVNRFALSSVGAIVGGAIPFLLLSRIGEVLLTGDIFWWWLYWLEELVPMSILEGNEARNCGGGFVDIGLHSFLLKIDSVLPVINPSLLVNYYSSSVLKCGKKQLFCWINMIQPPVVTRLSFQDGTTQWPQSHKSHIQQGLMSRERKSQLHSLY